MQRSKRIKQLANRYPKLSRFILNLSRQGILPHAVSDHWLGKEIGKDLNRPFDRAHWSRTVAYRECIKMIKGLTPKHLDALEISPSDVDVWRQIGFKSYHSLSFPGFDLCRDSPESVYDLIIADQIFEHLPWPYRAGKNVHGMLKQDGYFLMITPFLVRVHESPIDCSRWTEQGLKYLLAECGFPMDNVITGSWGNRACVKANLSKWARQKWYRSLRNEENFPIIVWALAQKT